MTIELTDLEYRRLLDMVYVGNWVLNSARGIRRRDEEQGLGLAGGAQSPLCPPLS